MTDIESIIARILWRVFLTGMMVTAMRFGGVSWWTCVAAAWGHFFLTGQLDQIYRSLGARELRK